MYVQKSDPVKQEVREFATPTPWDPWGAILYHVLNDRTFNLQS